ncbi:MAG: hypothetical protein JJ59_01315 [Candidatus Micrarchaeum sp. AZ1]|nr:MAG: hypothetical protein JJ59_01315 [Candidatus Micrarchaeum sp. AZ1]
MIIVKRTPKTKNRTKIVRKTKTKNLRTSTKYKITLMLIAIIIIGSIAFYSAYNLNAIKTNNLYTKNIAQNKSIISNQTSTNKTAALLSELFPRQGFKTPVKLNNIVPELVDSGALNLSKVEGLYGKNLTQQEFDVLTKPSYTNLTLNTSNANFYLLIFWALGISNKNSILSNFSADANSSNFTVANLASVGGWTLGTNSSGMAYFNKLQLLSLTPIAQGEMYYVATHTYRPCCDNPTAFPDCNHGAALLALMELGSSQGLNESQLYTLALQAQTLWFPSYYATTALELQYKNVSYWNNPQLVLGKNYSSLSGWYYNSYGPLKANNQLPSLGQAAACGT